MRTKVNNPDCSQVVSQVGPEKWVPDALDEQEAYLAERAGNLHRPISAGPDDEDDWVRCETCGTDLYSLAICPDAPTARCGCALYMVRDNDHMPHE